MLKLLDFVLYNMSNTICCNFLFQNFVKTMTEKLTNQQREYEAQQMHRQHLQVGPLSTPSKLSLVTLCGKVVNVNTSYLIFFLDCNISGLC